MPSAPTRTLPYLELDQQKVLKYLRLESGYLVVDRDVLPLYPHRVVAPEVDAFATVEPTADGKLPEFGASPATHAGAAQRTAHGGAARVVWAVDDKVLAMPPDVVEARHRQRDIARVCETRTRVDLRLLHVGQPLAAGRRVVQVEHVESPEARKRGCVLVLSSPNSKSEAEGEATAEGTHHETVGRGAREVYRLHLAWQSANERIDSEAGEALDAHAHGAQAGELG